MTTIAYRDGVLVGDGRLSSEGMIEGTFVKVGRCGRVLAGAAGHTPTAQAFMRWFKGGCVGAPILGTKDRPLEALIVRPGQPLIYINHGWGEIEAPFYAIGSGGSVATGAMAAGASAEEAVRIAMRYDPWTGDPLTVLRLPA